MRGEAGADRSRAALAFDRHQRLGKRVRLDARFHADFDDADRAGFVAQHDGCRVVADVFGIARLRLAGDALDVAEEEAREVENVDADVQDRIALRVMQIGLHRIDVVAGAKGDAAPGRLADRAAVEHALQLAHRRLPAEILVDGEPHAGLARGLDHRLRLAPIGRERLLQDDVDAGGGCELHHVEVALHARDDVDEVELLLRQHGRGVGVGARGAERLGGLLGLGPVEIAHRGDLDAFGAEIAPAVQMVLREEAAADDADPHGSPLTAPRSGTGGRRPAIGRRHAKALR